MECTVMVVSRVEFLQQFEALNAAALYEWEHCLYVVYASGRRSLYVV